jgi:hypothetical protein
MEVADEAKIGHGLDLTWKCAWSMDKKNRKVEENL